MQVIIIGQFKNTLQKHFINKCNTDDSLRRTTVKECATKFKNKKVALGFLEKMKIENARFNECVYSFERV